VILGPKYQPAAADGREQKREYATAKVFRIAPEDRLNRCCPARAEAEQMQVK
jgi:hypothetical protein